MSLQGAPSETGTLLFPFALTRKVLTMTMKKMKRLTLVALATLVAFVPISAFGSEITFRRGFTWEDAHAATFRVEVNGARGTAVFIGCPKDRPDVAVFFDELSRCYKK